MDFRRRLALDTSTLTQSLAIADGDAILGTLDLQRPRGRAGGHSRSLLSAVHGLADQCGLALEDIDLFVCGLGPGSFTGLRIGLSCLKGLALALTTPIAGLSSLEAMAMKAGAPGLVVPILDARKKEVYAGAYRGGMCALSDRAIAPSDLVQTLETMARDGEPITFLGQGIGPYRAIFEPHGRLLGHLFDSPSASALALMAGALRQDDLSDPAGLEPNYQRASDAERNVAVPKQ
jgi:tRNA threonylcarbamoyladenosine biosynthesis protein TsaB